MKKLLLDIICCPVCKSELKLEVTKEEGDEIIEGSFYCEKCNFHYPIEDGIPNFLPPDLQKSYNEKKGRKK